MNDASNEHDKEEEAHGHCCGAMKGTCWGESEEREWVQRERRGRCARAGRDVTAEEGVSGTVWQTRTACREVEEGNTTRKKLNIATRGKIKRNKKVRLTCENL